jgi:hypothetical protein
MQLRMLAAEIIGVGPMGHDGTAMRKMMMEMERNASGGEGYTAVDFG